MCASPTSTPRSSAEVCVIGGGPAGSAAALRLTQMGHRVLLVDRAPRSRPHVGESLPPSVLPLLDSLGLRERLESTGVLQQRESAVHWPGDMPMAQAPAAVAGWQVARDRFDALLLDAARRAGVQVLRATAGAARPLGTRWQVPLPGGDVVDAAMVIDARGRRAHPATGARTVALCGCWTGLAVEDSRTRVEAGTSAWSWAMPLPGGRVNAVVFIDAARCAGLDAGARAALYRDLLGTPRWLGRKQCGAVQPCDATPRMVADAAPLPGLLQVGDAAFTIDPLSSQGVTAALRSAVQAAACVHTALERPADAVLAWAFHRAQMQRASRMHARLAAGYYARAAEHFRHPFWTARTVEADPPPGRVPQPERAWPTLDQRLALDAQARWTHEPALEGDWVRSHDALLHPALDAPIAFLAEHPVAAWLDPLRSRPALRDLLDLWHQRFGEARTRSVWPLLWRQGLIVVSS
jgi:flavin-dependent dehydrogenase